MVANIRASTADARYRYRSFSSWMYRHSSTSKAVAQKAIKMSLRPKRLKYSRVGDTASMVPANREPARPRCWRRK